MTRIFPRECFLFTSPTLSCSQSSVPWQIRRVSEFTFCKEKSKINIAPGADQHNFSDKIQSQSRLNDLPGFHQNSQNRVQAINELVPLGNCSWVDIAEQVYFILIFWFTKQLPPIQLDPFQRSKVSRNQRTSIEILDELAEMMFQGPSSDMVAIFLLLVGHYIIIDYNSLLPFS